MSKKVGPSAAAMDEFFHISLPGDEFLLVSFNDRPRYVTGFTTDIDDISARLHAVKPEGWTALNDAMYMGLQKMSGARNTRRVLLVLSDGGDNNSRYSSRELRALVRETDVQIYSISFFEGSRLLEEISSETGGSATRLHKVSDLPEAIEKVSREIRNQYVLSYQSSASLQNDGKYRKVLVRVADPQLRVSWKHGYYAPLE
jgi:Ca-activated chloride channel family protein